MRTGKKLLQEQFDDKCVLDALSIRALRRHCVRLMPLCLELSVSREREQAPIRLVRPRVGALPRVPNSRASAPPTRTNRAFRKQSHREGAQTKLEGLTESHGAPRQTPQRTVACTASAARRQGCPETTTKPGRQPKACATDGTPTAPRPTTGTPPLNKRRQLESRDRDDGGAFHQ